MSTTLVEELERAARSFDAQAHKYQGLLAPSEYTAERDRCQAFAARLRQRAAWVGGLEAKAAKADCLGCCDCDDLRTIRLLTGPIPSETAPAAPKDE